MFLNEIDNYLLKIPCMTNISFDLGYFCWKIFIAVFGDIA